jgi:hypothetical protein
MNRSSEALRLLSVALLTVPAALAAQQTVQLPAADKVLRERPAVIYQVGAEEGEEWELLSGVNSVAFDAQDNLYILDRNNFRVLVFDPSGKFLRKIGKQGGGPGEFIAPVSMTITSDGSLVVGDIGRRGYSIFKTDGTFVKNVIPEEGVGVGGGGIQAHPRGGIVANAANAMMFGGGRRSGTPGDITQMATRAAQERKMDVAWLNFANTEGGKSTTLYEAKLPPITPKVEESGTSENRQVRVMSRAPEFMPQATFGVLPNGGVAVAHEADYRIRVVDPAGKVARVLERPIKPKKATKKDQELAVERRREAMQRGDGMVRVMVDNGNTRVSTGGGGGRQPEAAAIEEMLRTTTFLEFIPVFRRIDTDPQGRIWVQRTPTDFGTRGPVDILTFDGRYIGTVPSDRAPSAVSRSGRAAYIERDDLNVEHVVVKRLPETWK